MKSTKGCLHGLYQCTFSCAAARGLSMKLSWMPWIWYPLTRSSESILLIVRGVTNSMLRLEVKEGRRDSIARILLAMAEPSWILCSNLFHLVWLILFICSEPPPSAFLNAVSCLMFLTSAKYHLRCSKVQELVNYLIRNQLHEERDAFICPFRELFIFTYWVMVRKKVLRFPFHLWQNHWKCAIEIEGFFNLIFAQLFSLFSPSSQEVIKHADVLLKVISSAPSDQHSIKYKMYIFVYTLRYRALKYLP